LANSDLKVLKNYLGKWGQYLHSFANGTDSSLVKPYYYKSPFKSIGNSLTNYKDIINDHDIMALILILSESVVFRAKELKISKCTGVSLWVRNSQLESTSFQTKILPTLLIDTIAKTAFKLFKDNYNSPLKVRSMGISIYGFKEDEQINFIDYDKLQKQYRLENALLKIKNKYGNSAIARGVVVRDSRLHSLDIKSEHIIHPESYFKK